MPYISYVYLSLQIGHLGVGKKRAQQRKKVQVMLYKSSSSIKDSLYNF